MAWASSHLRRRYRVLRLPGLATPATHVQNQKYDHGHQADHARDDRTDAVLIRGQSPGKGEPGNSHNRGKEITGRFFTDISFFSMARLAGGWKVCIDSS